MVLVLASCVVLFVTVGRGTLLAVSDTVLFATESEARLGQHWNWVLSDWKSWISISFGGVLLLQ